MKESSLLATVPMLLAAKLGRGVHIYQDYQGLNAIIVKNHYPLPLICKTLDLLCKAKYYTKLDIITAFN